jgi:hypothetical protein
MENALNGKNTFQLGLCKAGAVSAGVYTASIPDYLIVTLDTWNKKKKSGEENVPTHNVVIPVKWMTRDYIENNLKAFLFYVTFKYNTDKTNPYYILRFRRLLKKRIQAVVLHQTALPTLKHFGLWFVCKLFLNGFAAGKIIGPIKASLKEARLIN